MRRIASRLLGQLVHLYRSLQKRLSRFRRWFRPSPRATTQPALGLRPLENRDHTGNMVGGIALAGLGFANSDPLDAMALAVGDVALYGGGHSTDEPAPITVGDPPVPLNKWLPDDLTSWDFVPPPEDVAPAGGAATDGAEASLLAKPSDDFWPGSSDGDGAGSSAGSGWSVSATSDDVGKSPISRGAGAIPTANYSEPSLGVEPAGVSAFDLLTGWSSTPQPLSVTGTGEPPSAIEGGESAGSDVEVPTGASPGGEGGGELVSEGGGELDTVTVPQAVGASDESGVVPLVLVVATDPNASEAGESTGQFRITRVGPIGAPLTVAFVLGADDGNATLDEDYRLEAWGGSVSWGSVVAGATGEVTFGAGARTVTLTVRPIDTVEEEEEVEETEAEETEWVSFGLLPSPEQAYSVDRLYHAEVQLTDNDGPVSPDTEPDTESGDALVWVRASDPTSAEGGGTAAFEFFRDTTEGELSAYYLVMTKSTATEGTFTEGGEYVTNDYALTGDYRQVTFPDGEDRVVVVLDPADDGLLEGEETVWVELALPPGTIGDYVWKDGNGDGIQDDHEKGLADVNVTVTSVDQTFTLTTKTDKTGYYRFSDLPEGDYTLHFEAPTGYVFTKQYAGDDGGRDSNAFADGNTTSFTIDYDLPGDPTLDAGLHQLTTIGNYVWHDADGDGIQDESEGPIPHPVEVWLYNDKGEAVKNAKTDQYGYYQFTDVVPGKYSIQFVPPRGRGSCSPGRTRRGRTGRTTTRSTVMPTVGRGRRRNLR